MVETIQKEWQAKGAILLFVVLTIWWFVSPSVSGKRFFGDFPSIYAIVALWGAIWGVLISRRWGFMKSVLGQALFMFSLGLFAQVFGQVVYAYYSFFLHIDVPYPSWGDLGYFGSIPLYAYGVILLGKASGVSIGLKSIKSQIQAVIIPLVILSVGYFLFLQHYKVDPTNPLKTFLDFGYPLGQAIYISLALLTYLLSRGILGGIMKNKILFILFALLVQFSSDYTFLYQSNNGTWKAGGFNDYMYLVAYLLMTLGLLQFNTVLGKLHGGKV